MHHLVYFFCFRHHHTYTIFSLRYYVVVILALRVPSNSVSLLHDFAPCLHTSFPICLLKFSCNLSHNWALSLLNKLRSLAFVSRVFLLHLIKLCLFSIFTPLMYASSILLLPQVQFFLVVKVLIHLLPS